MSKIKALITTLVLGSSSIAAADSAFTFNASAHVGIGAPVAAPPAVTVVRDHRVEPAYAPPAVTPVFAPNRDRYRPAWVALSEPTMLRHNRTMIRIDTPSRYSQLRLQTTAGASYVTSVMIRFADGTRQEIAVNKWLDTRAPMFDLAISNRSSIERVIIIGSTNRRASFQLFGTPTYSRRWIRPAR